MGKVTNCKSREINWMKYKIGIIGATQSVEKIMTVSREFEDGIKFIPLPFEDEKEIQPILHNNKKSGWLAFFRTSALRHCQRVSGK